jgi:predicted nucleic acid-binding protein
MKTLIFIDTNIFLDFYRATGREANTAILKHIDQNHNVIISSNQVEMEYMKNRQRVILEAYKQLTYPHENRFGSMPAFLATAKQAGPIIAKQKETRKLLETLQKRVVKILREPTTNDIVYQCAH